MKVEAISIDKIKNIGNVRQRITEKDVSELMNSIKYDGLLQPIGVIKANAHFNLVYGARRLEACKKLGYKEIDAVIIDKADDKELVIKNTAENIHREDVSVTEQGRIFVLLKKQYNMTDSEIASRFGISKTFVERAMNVFNLLPNELRGKVKKFKFRRPKKGEIPYTLADRIIRLGKRAHVKDKELTYILEIAKEDWFTVEHIESLFYFMAEGHILEDAIVLSKKYLFVNLKIPVDIKELDKKMKEKGYVHKYKFFRDIITGKLKTTLKLPAWARDKK